MPCTWPKAMLKAMLWIVAGGALSMGGVTPPAIGKV